MTVCLKNRLNEDKFIPYLSYNAKQKLISIRLNNDMEVGQSFAIVK